MHGLAYAYTGYRNMAELSCLASHWPTVGSIQSLQYLSVALAYGVRFIFRMAADKRRSLRGRCGVESIFPTREWSLLVSVAAHGVNIHRGTAEIYWGNEQKRGMYDQTSSGELVSGNGQWKQTDAYRSVDARPAMPSLHSHRLQVRVRLIFLSWTSSFHAQHPQLHPIYLPPDFVSKGATTHWVQVSVISRGSGYEWWYRGRGCHHFSSPDHRKQKPVQTIIFLGHSFR